ncbi:MAG: hypothetical protein RL577_804 [Bacteroidota bacterium]
MAAFVATLAFSTVSFAQDFELEGGANSHDFYPESSGYMDCAIHVTNKLSSDLILEYKKVSVDFPSAWDVSFCDNRNCYGVFIDQDTMFPISSQQDAYLKITVFPNGVADTAVVKYAIWNRYNESSMDTLTYNIFVRWSAGRVSLMSGEVARVYPVPVSEVLNVDLRGVQNASIFDAMGRKVMQLPVQEQAQVQVGQWPAGTYTLRYQEGVNTLSQSFIIGQ